MPAITHGHERTPERMAIDGAFNLHQPPSSEESDGLRPDDVSPAASLGTFPQLGPESPVDGVRCRHVKCLRVPLAHAYTSRRIGRPKIDRIPLAELFS